MEPCTHEDGCYQKKKQKQEISVGKVMEKRAQLYAANESVKWYSHCGKYYGSSPSKLKI